MENINQVLSYSRPFFNLVGGDWCSGPAGC
jgi:hypothetical protein